MVKGTTWLVALLVLAGFASLGAAAEVTISPGDTLRLEVLGEAELSAAYTVASDGSISIPLGGAVTVAGLTARDATTRVAQALAAYIVDPQATLTIAERAKLKVTVAGAVVKPGALAVPPGTCIAEAIGAVGGLLPQANAAAVRIVHVQGSDTPVNLAALARGDVTQNRELAQGDQVIVPVLTAETGVRVTGMVKQPGLYPVAEEMTLWDAIAAAGGLEANASPRDAVVTRAGGEKVAADLTQLMSGAGIESGLRLKPGDTLTVPGMAAQVYLLGAVHRSGPYMMPAGVTLLDVLARGGGVTPTARLRDAYLLRADATTGEVTRLGLRLDLLLGKGDSTADVALQDGDKITIPEAGPRRRSLMEKAQPYLMPLIYLLGVL